MINYMRQNILVIDDDQELLDLIKRFLERRGFNVQTARDAEEALFLFEEYSVDIILCDVMMPNVNGIEFIKMLKHQFEKKFEIIMMSGRPASEEFLGSFQDYVCDYLQKPIQRTDLLNSLRRAGKNLDRALNPL